MLLHAGGRPLLRLLPSDHLPHCGPRRWHPGLPRGEWGIGRKKVSSYTPVGIGRGGRGGCVAAPAPHGGLLSPSGDETEKGRKRTSEGVGQGNREGLAHQRGVALAGQGPPNCERSGSLRRWSRRWPSRSLVRPFLPVCVHACVLGVPQERFFLALEQQVAKIDPSLLPPPPPSCLPASC